LSAVAGPDGSGGRLGAAASPGEVQWGPAARSMWRALLWRPALWPAGMVAVVRLARPGWWRRWPPLPLPSTGLWRFRMETAYGGSGDAAPDEDDVVSFLQWSRSLRRWRRH